MAGYTAKEIERAREMDLLTYLRPNDPGNLIHISGGEYCTREHDSLKISNGKWMWWSRGFGGVSALFSMLNSCSSGVSVVNIDNGFGAGYLANIINQMESIKE